MRWLLLLLGVVACLGAGGLGPVGAKANSAPIYVPFPSGAPNPAATRAVNSINARNHLAPVTPRQLANGLPVGSGSASGARTPPGARTRPTRPKPKTRRTVGRRPHMEQPRMRAPLRSTAGSAPGTGSKVFQRAGLSTSGGSGSLAPSTLLLVVGLALVMAAASAATWSRIRSGQRADL